MAIILFAFGALLAARMQTTSLKSTTFGNEALIATTAAQTLIEQLKEQTNLGNFAAVVLPGSGFAPVRPDNTPANIQAGTGGVGQQPIPDMTIGWTTSNLNGTTGTRYTTVTVTIQWAGNARSYTTTTIISEN